MAKPFDVTTKQLVELRPVDWVRFLGLPGEAAEVIDADLSTVTTEADRVLRVRAQPTDYLTHLEFTAHVDDLEERTLRYNVLLHYEYQIPVVSVIVVLRPAAETPRTRLSGQARYDGPDGSPVIEFRYEVVRIWEQNTEELLTGGLATLPLAPLTDNAQSDLPAVISRMQRRIDAEATEKEAREIWASTFVLFGLRHRPEVAYELLKGVHQLKESSTYQWLLNEGRNEGRNEGMIAGQIKGQIEGELTEARRLLVLLGSRRLGAPSAEIEGRLAAIDAREQIEALALRVSEVETWDDLLAGML